jgi:3-isopropylmalate dehydrogenase
VSRTFRIVLLPGDGVGPEVAAAARAVLESLAGQAGFDLDFETALVGGAALEATGSPLPEETFRACERSDAIFLGAVGDPRWASREPELRPERALLDLRSRLGLYANLRPIPVFPELAAETPLRPELLAGVDILFVRELAGGLYYGERREQGGGESAFDTMAYTVEEVERIARLAFAAAAGRRGKVTSVDKANVLASMRLWRRTVDRIAEEFPGVTLEHQLVDSCAMRLLREPASFDVVLTPNLFGDILSDEAAVLSGSLGILPSASLGSPGPPLFEPVHGSAPDIAGRGIANPIGAILSAALLLRHALGLEEQAARVESAVAGALAKGLRTADLGGEGPRLGTEEATAAVLAEL